MADDKTKNVIATAFAGNEKFEITFDHVLRALVENESEIDTALNEMIAYTGGDGDYFTINLHPDTMEEIPVKGDNSASIAYLRAGDYGAVTKAYLCDVDREEIEGSVFLIKDKDTISKLAGLDLLNVSICMTDGVEIGEEKESYWALQDTETKSFISYENFISGAVLAATISMIGKSSGISLSLKDEGNKVLEEVQLANIKLNESFSNHSLILKTLDDGLFHIAMGNDDWELGPRSGNSQESYKLTASKGACSDFFKNGGNAEIAKTVIQTVYAIRSDESAETFIKNGRIWITLNTIVQEMRRTNAGTVSAKDYKNDREMVDRALLAVSGAQIVGTKANGEPVNSIYVMNAVRRDAVVFNNQTYYDVWGFETDVTTANDYAKDLGQTHRYPLLKMGKPLTFDEAWIDRYLKDILNQARNELYTTDKNGNPRPTKATKARVVRSWDAIFTRIHPVGELESRKKTAVVKKFEKMLNVLAEMDCRDELRVGYPMSIKAYSERDARRGRGRGAWVNLVVECKREMHRPKVDLS